MMTENGHISISIDHLSEDGNVQETNDLSATEDSQECSSQENVEFNCVENEIDFDLPLQQLLYEIQKVLYNRFDDIENKLDHLNQCCHLLEQKVDKLASSVEDHNQQMGLKKANQTVIVGVPQGSPGSSPQGINYSPHAARFGPKVTLITLNTEADYPQGSWLGDETNPEQRVRCHISPTDLLHIVTTCHTPEKMALTLLDYLFDRETQACSNISGTGKHKKKQLDPLMIYGIRCHLIHKFGITEKDWHRIKQNMDSKCRTAFRRKMKGLSLTGQDSENELSMDPSEMGISGDEANSTISLHEATIKLVDQTDLTAVMQGAQIIHTPEGDIQVLHATPEQIAKIQQTHQIQILTGDHVLQTTDGQIIQEIANGTQLLKGEEIEEDLEDN